MAIYQWGTLGSVSLTGTVDTELPPAAPLADGMANPTVPGVGGFMLAWDTVDWDRLRSFGGILQAQGAEAHDNPVGSFRPILLAGYGSTATPAPVSADGDVCNVWVDRNGRAQVTTANRTAGGTLNGLNATVVMTGENLSSVIWEVDSGLTGTVVFEATVDDANWFQISSIRLDGTTIGNTSSFPDRAYLNGTGYSQVRLRVSAYTSGSSAARMEGSAAGYGLIVPVSIGKISTTQSLNVADGGTSLTIDTNSGPISVITDTEIPAAVALSDNMTNPTTPLLGACHMGYDESAGQWDRVRVDTGGRMQSAIGSWLGSTAPTVGQKTMSNSLPVAIASDQSNVAVTAAQATASNLNAEVQGDAAHGTSVSGNPVLLGLEARTSNATAVSNGQAVRAMADDMGRQIVVANGVRDLVTQNNIQLTTTTETTVLAGGGGSTFLDITRLILSNAGTAAVSVDIRDTTGGSVRLSVMLAANGGGAVLPFDPPLKQTTAGNNWTARLSAAGDVRIFAQAVQNV